jgi:hypothetical protein
MVKCAKQSFASKNRTKKSSNVLKQSSASRFIFLFGQKQKKQADNGHFPGG